MNDFYLVFASYFFLTGIAHCESEKPWAGILSIFWSVFLGYIWWQAHLELLRTG